MRLVVDAIVIVSALLEDSVTGRLLKNPSLELYTVDYVRSEFDEHMGELCRRSGLCEDQRSTLILGLLKNVRVVATSEFKREISMAMQLIDDVDDVPYPGACAVFWTRRGCKVK